MAIHSLCRGQLPQMLDTLTMHFGLRRRFAPERMFVQSSCQICSPAREPSATKNDLCGHSDRGTAVAAVSSSSIISDHPNYVIVL